MMRVGDDRSRSRWLQVGVTGAALAVAFYAGRVTTPEKAAAGTAGGTTEARLVSERSQESEPRGAREEGRSARNAGGSAPVTRADEFVKLYYGEAVTPADRALAALDASQAAELARSMLSRDELQSNSGSAAANEVWARWGELDGPAAMAAAEAIPLVTCKWPMEAAFKGWALKDPAAAEAALARIEDPVERGKLRELVMKGLAVKDPDAWIARLAVDSSLGREGVNAIALEWSYSDPAGALARILKLPAHLRAGAMAPVARNWAVNHPKKALEWAQALPPGGDQDQALKSVLFSVAQYHAEDALAVVESLPAPEREGIRKIAFRKLAAHDFENAFTRACALPEEGAREVVVSWLVTGPWPPGVAAEKYQSLVLGLPAGDARAQGLESLAEGCVKLSPDESAAFLARCGLEDRQEIARKMVRDLQATDPEAARAAVMAGGFSEQERTCFLEALEK